MKPIITVQKQRILKTVQRDLDTAEHTWPAVKNDFLKQSKPPTIDRTPFKENSVVVDRLTPFSKPSSGKSRVILSMSARLEITETHKINLVDCDFLFWFDVTDLDSDAISLILSSL